MCYSSKLVFLLHAKKYKTLVQKKQKNNKLKITALTWNDKFEFSNYSYSVTDIQDYICYIITNDETFSDDPLIHIYINRINN